VPSLAARTVPSDATNALKAKIKGSVRKRDQPSQ